jgi:hypothetical protein
VPRIVIFAHHEADGAQNFWQPYYWILKSTVDKWTDGDMSNSAALRKSFTDHYDNVRAKVPKDKLLEFHPREGWAPLCNFLGHDTVQGIPFPKINDAASTVRLHYIIVLITLWNMFGKYVMMALAAMLAYVISRWMRAG